MGLFRRSKPLHQRLAEEAGLSLGDVSESPPALAAEPPGWDGEARGEPGIHGVPRTRRWDAVATLEEQELHGDVVRFVVLPDGSALVEEDEPDAPIARLVEAIEALLAAPYRAEAVRQSGSTWAVGANRIVVARVPGLDGDEAELVGTRSGVSLRLDGRQSLRSSPDLERLGETQGSEYVVRARRLEGDLWEVEATPL